VKTQKKALAALLSFLMLFGCSPGSASSIDTAQFTVLSDGEPIGEPVELRLGESKTFTFALPFEECEASVDAGEHVGVSYADGE
jgi:hypothetical protein